MRLYRFTNPIADWHSWRQSDTSAVSKFLIKDNFNIMYPRYFDISNVQSGKDNPLGLRYVEFPLYNLAQAGSYVLLGHFTLEEWGRLVTIFSSLLSCVFIYLLGKRYANTTVGISAAAFYAFIPYNIYYGRTILPDPSMAMAVLGATYFYSRWVDTQKNFEKIIFYLLSFLFLSCAYLLKPYTIFFLLPIFWITWSRYGLASGKKILVWLFFTMTLIPLGLWRVWMLQHPEGIPASSWLLNGGNIRFTGAFFYWIFSIRLGRLILGGWGISIVLMGLLSRKTKNYGFFVASALASLAYIVVIARGNVQHDYYQILIIPTLSFFFGLGADFLLNISKYGLSKYLSLAVLLVCTLFMIAFRWYDVRDYFNINNPSLIIAGKAVSEVTPENAKIVAPMDGDTTFLYQANRQGWPSFEHDLPTLIHMGADYLVVVNPTQSDFTGFGKQYKTVASSSAYLILDLHKNK